MALCTQEDVEDTLQIEFDNNPEPVITRLIARASQLVKDHLHREIEENTYEETLDGRRQRILKLRESPVTAIASVVENGYTLTEGDDFLWYPDGRLVRMAGSVESRWHGLRQATVVNYTAGYPAGSIPESIVDVTAGIVVAKFQKGAEYANTPSGVTGGIKSVSLDGSDTIEYSDKAEKDPWKIEQSELARISKYKRRLHL